MAETQYETGWVKDADTWRPPPQPPFLGPHQHPANDLYGIGTTAPNGVIGRAEYVQAGVTALPLGESDLPGLSVPVTVPAGRTLKITTFVCMGGGSTNECRIYRDGLQLNRSHFSGTAPNICTHTFSVLDFPAAGAHTYKVTQINASAGTLYADGTNEAWLAVEDITPTLGVSVGGHAHPEYAPVSDSGWLSLVPLLVNGWVSYDNNYGPPRYRKLNGVVYIQGLIRSGTLGNTVATMPVGFRPSGLWVTLFSTLGDNNVPNRYDLYGDGRLINAGGASNVWSSLNGITYPADA